MLWRLLSDGQWHPRSTLAQLAREERIKDIREACRGLVRRGLLEECAGNLRRTDLAQPAEDTAEALAVGETQAVPPFDDCERCAFYGEERTQATTTGMAAEGSWNGKRLCQRCVGQLREAARAAEADAQDMGVLATDEEGTLYRVRSSVVRRRAAAPVAQLECVPVLTVEEAGAVEVTEPQTGWEATPAPVLSAAPEPATPAGFVHEGFRPCDGTCLDGGPCDPWERARRGREAVTEADYGVAPTLRRILDVAAVMADELEGQPTDNLREHLRDLIAAAAVELGGLA